MSATRRTATDARPRSKGAPRSVRLGAARPAARRSSVVILGAIMSILDTTIVNVAIDALARDFHAPLSTIQWVSTGYMLALGRHPAHRLGVGPLRHEAALHALASFLVGSALCGTAWSASR